MALGVKKGTFALNTSTGNQTVDTGVGVTLKALLLFGTKQTADAFAASNYSFQGWAVSSTQRAVLAWGADDNIASPDVGVGYSNALILRYFSDATTPTVEAEADFVDFTTGGAGRFTINVTDAPAAGDQIHYVAFYGTDLTNVAVKEFTAKITSTGTKAETGVGFQGKAMLLMGLARTATGNAAGLNCWMGAAVSTTQRGSIYWGARDGHTSSEEHYRNATKCVSIPVANGNAIDALADFVSWDSDGFTLDWTDFAASAWLCSALVFKGGQFEVDTILAPAATGNQDITTAFDPTGVFLFGTGQTTADATEGAEAHVAIGGGDGTTEGHIWGVEDNVVNTDANMRTNTTKAIGVATHPSTVAAEADLTLGTSKYSLNWTTTRENSAFFGLAVGNAGGASISRSASDALTLADSVARVFVGVRTTTNTLTLADTTTRTFVGERTATEALTLADVATQIKEILRSASDAIGLSDAATRLGTFVRSASDALTLADVASRTGTFVRSTSDALTLSDVATQIKEILRSASDAIGLSDVVTRVGTFVRTVSDALTLADTASRVGSFSRTASDSLTLADVASQVRALVRSVADAIGLSDAATRLGSFVRTTSDAVGLADVATQLIVSVGGVVGGIPPLIRAAYHTIGRLLAGHDRPRGSGGHSTPRGR